MVARSVRVRPTIAVLLWLAAICLLALSEGFTVALLLAPTALLAIVLPFGRYPGERVLHRIRRRATSACRTVAALVPRAPRRLGSTCSALVLPGSERGPPVAASLI